MHAALRAASRACVMLGIAIAIQAGLEFLGLGDLNLPTWGGLLRNGFAEIYDAPLLTLWPSLVIGLTCIALTLLGNAMRDELEQSGAAPKKRGAVSEIVREPVVTHAEEAGAKIGETLLEVTDLRVGYDRREILPPMPWSWLAQATDDDLKAIYAYLKTVPPIKNRVPDPVPPAPAGKPS